MIAIPLLIVILLAVPQIPNFHLNQTSPAIGKATCTTVVRTDFDGNPRPTPGRPAGQGCDMGAFQFTGSQPPQLPANDVTPPTIVISIK